MKFDLGSDLHWDFNILKNPLNPIESDIFVIAGDIANGVTKAQVLLSFASKQYKHVVFVAGNHEFYDGNELKDSEFKLKDFSDEKENVHFLTSSNPYWEHENTIFVGVTGWYNLKNRQVWYDFSNDSHINYGEGKNPGYMAKKDTESLLNALENFVGSTKEIVIVTHMPPMEELTHPKYKGESHNEFYYNPNMQEVIELLNLQASNFIWCYGHTHYRLDKQINNIRFINNSRGYPHDLGYDRWQLQQIDTKD